MFENLKGSIMREIYSVSEFYRDYRHLQDDKTVLKNPHKGWYWHFIDNGIQRPQYREGIGGDTMSDFPCLNHLYLRFDWGDIEKREGIYDWSYIDTVMKYWVGLGYKFSLRICCYEGGDIKYATPEWVRDAGAKGYMCGDDCWQPDYGDSIFLEKLENFLKQCSLKFNNNPLIEYIDVGTYGTWGEGHTGFGTGDSYPTDVLIRHINLHLKYFSEKYVILNDDMINASANENGTRRRELLNYCAGKGMGFRDDSVLCACYVKPGCFGYDTLRTPFMFDKFYEQAPIDIETEHYTSIDDETFKDGLPLIDCLRRTHATFCGFHGYPRPWLEKHAYLADYLANRLGYWYFLDAMEIPASISGLVSTAKIYLSNRGFCHAYYPYDLKIRLSGEKTYGIGNLYGINTRIKAESSAEFTVKLDFSNVPKGDYILEIGMFEGENPIRLGFKKECAGCDGYYKIDNLRVE